MVARWESFFITYFRKSLTYRLQLYGFKKADGLSITFTIILFTKIHCTKFVRASIISEKRSGIAA